MASNINPRANFDDIMSLSNGNMGDSLQSELESLLRLRHNRNIIDQESDLNIYRSGSAPPTVQGSLRAVGSLYRNSEFQDISSVDRNNITGVLSEDEVLSHPAYLSYYYSHENINPRLPPPLLSKEDWRVAQRFQGGASSIGGLGDWRKNRLVDDCSESPSLFSMQPGPSIGSAEHDLMELRKAAGREVSRQAPAEWLDRNSDGLAGFSSAGQSMRRKSFADILQEGLEQPAHLSGHLSRPASRNAFDSTVDTRGISHPHPSELYDRLESIEGLPSGGSTAGLVRGQNLGTTVSHSFAPAVGKSLSRSTTPEPQLVGRSVGPGPVGSRVSSNLQNGLPSGVPDIADIEATLSSISLSKNNHVQSQTPINSENHPDALFNMPDIRIQSVHQQLINKYKAEKLATAANYADLSRTNGNIPDLNSSDINFDGRVNFPKRTSSSANLYLKGNSSGFATLEGSNVHYHQKPNMQSMDFNGSGYFANEKLNSAINKHLDTGSAFTNGAEAPILNRNQYQERPDLNASTMDPRFISYLHRNFDNTNHALASPSGLSPGRNNLGTRGDLMELQKGYLQALRAQQKQQYELPLLGKSGVANHGFYGNQLYGLGMHYPGSSMENSMLPSVGETGNPMFQNERYSHFNSLMISPMGGSMGSWHSDVATNMNGILISSILEEFKNNKTRCFELADIGDHLVEFSTDQYGSRFIQQKLETASVEEKMKIFPQIIPHARTLMTDVFGNYVIQKFFEHGTENQRKELASQLIGHVLPLSLQMYGCRVIQKALEVVDLEQKTEMVAELDGSVMKCVRDQNGNHVIQKCIECVPQDKIQFIISSFYGQVVALSTHPYGCRVIQRVLEHCDDPNTQQFIMDEIMQSVTTLAQDQYGNYVIQHVLQCGKAHERSAIISKLAGQIVKMSQQKFASNVIEKCLTFGGPEERQLLVNEMLGSTDENEPLQAMMKDPFGNYVAQKVLETCDDQSLELILSRIRVHLNSLKKYTYGKHIVSRVEKLIATGERRIGLLSSLPA